MTPILTRKGDRDYAAEWRLRHPEKAEAREVVRKAVQGKQLIKPQLCERCWVRYRPAELQAHHRDYSKPLQIIWLCQACHLEAHGRDGRSLRARRRKAPPPTARQVETMQLVASSEGAMTTRGLREALVELGRPITQQGLSKRLVRMNEDGYLHKDCPRGIGGTAYWSLTSKGRAALAPVSSEPGEGK